MVAERWPEMERIANGASLGTPAPGGLHLSRGMQWLEDFFSNCSAMYGDRGCRVDFVAVHFYECDGRTEESAENTEITLVACSPYLQAKGELRF